MPNSTPRLSRRMVIQLAAGTAAVAALAPMVSWSDNGTLIGSLESHDKKTSALLMWKIGEREALLVDSPYYFHSFIQNPARREHLWAIPKYEGIAALFDFKQRKFVTLYSSATGFQFNGHAQFHPNFSELVTSEQQEGEEEGRICVRSGHDFRVQRSFSSGGGLPHEILFVEGGKTLLVANMGGKDAPPEASNISWIDYESGRLLKQSFPKVPSAFGHFQIDSQGWIVASGREARDKKPDAECKGMLWSLGPNGEHHLLRIPANLGIDFNDEAATLQIDGEQHLAYAISRSAKSICVWDYRRGEFQRALETKGCTGLVSHGQEILTLNTHQGQILSVSRPWLKMSTASAFSAAKFYGGPHLMIFSV